MSGLLGMPRRVYTYPAGLNWEWPNLLSTLGAGLLAAGAVVFLLDLVLHLRPAGKVDTNPGNAPTLEWFPLDTYGARSIPQIESRNPLWDQPALREEVARGEHYLPGTATGEREALITSPFATRPQYVLVLPRLAPAGHGYGATVASTILVQALVVAALVVLAAYTLARSWTGRLGAARRATFDHTMLLWHYTAGQGVIALAALHALPRWLG